MLKTALDLSREAVLSYIPECYPSLYTTPQPEYIGQYSASYYQLVAQHANFEYTDDQAKALPLPEEQLDTFEDEEVEAEQIPDESTKGFKKVS